jgi:anti-sigma factor RsiW
MQCSRYREWIQELTDGTLGAIRKAELERHVDECASCSAFAADLQAIRDATASLAPLAPPDGVWLQLAGRLMQEGRVSLPPARPAAPARHAALLAIAAALVLAVGAALFLVIPREIGSRDVAGVATPGNAPAVDAVQSGVDDLRKAETLLQSGVAKLKEGLGTDNALPAAVANTLDSGLQSYDRAIADVSAELQSDPQNVTARNSLFDLLQRKISLLQDTITLMNEMRKGNAAGVAQVVEGGNKS